MNKHFYFAVLLPVALAAEQDIPITDAQADAIVADMASKENQRQAEMPDITVLQRREVDLDDRTLTMDRVSPPELTPRTLKPDTPELTPEQRQALMDEVKVISATATVYDDSVTLLRWQDDEDAQYIGWSTANFNLLRTVQEFTVDEQKYRLAVMVLSENTEDLKERRRLALAEGIELQLPVIPELPPSSDGKAEYFVEAEDESIFQNEEAFAGMDATHEFYNQSLERLVIAHENSQKMLAARKRYESENPEPNESRLIHWRNE